jgi:hypothetical protein
MSEMLVMRRANGKFFMEEVNGKRRIPLWSSEDALARYKERNPHLITFLPARLTDSLLDRIRSAAGNEGATEFFLLADDSPDASLDDGRPISLEEVFAASEHSTHPVPA